MKGGSGRGHNGEQVKHGRARCHTRTMAKPEGLRGARCSPCRAGQRKVFTLSVARRGRIGGAGRVGQGRVAWGGRKKGGVVRGHNEVRGKKGEERCGV